MFCYTTNVKTDLLTVVGVLQVSGGSEWQQDCLACLLKLLCQLGMSPIVDDSVPNKNKRKRCSKADKQLVIPKLSQVMMNIHVS